MIADAETPSDPFQATDTASLGSPGAQRSAASGEARRAQSSPGADPDTDALFLDVDGTLLTIAPHPDAVEVSDDLLRLLDRLAARTDGAVALISGRAIANLDALFDPLRLPCAGVHGLERRGADAVVHRSNAAALLEPLRPALAGFVAARHGLLLEDKQQSLALHFRNAPGCEGEAEAFIRALIAPHAKELELKRGKMVLEVKPSGANKGTAIAAFMTEPPFSGRRPVFIGDDVTDEDGFAVVNRLGGLSIRVGSGGRTAAACRLADEAAVHAWLRGLLAGGERRETL
ncbi:MAG: trehalose-phosphatase [Kiloniellaceae bacterium]